MMGRCQICKEREGETHVDNDLVICYGCYKKAADYLFKGDFTLLEIEKSIKEINEYATMVTKMMLLLENFINTKNSTLEQDERLNIYDELMNLRKYENIKSLEYFNKSRNCLTKMEHLKIIKYVCYLYELEGITLDNIFKVNPSDKLTDTYLNRYLAECTYLDFNRW